jgi:hypothetical protein
MTVDSILQASLKTSLISTGIHFCGHMMMRERIAKWLLVLFDGVVMPPWGITPVYPSNRRKKFIVELLSKRHILPLFRIFDSNLISRRNHTPPNRSIQAPSPNAEFVSCHNASPTPTRCRNPNRG